MTQNMLNVALIDDDEDFGLTLKGDLRLLSRSSARPVSMTWWSSCDAFVEHLAKGDSAHVDLVIIDENAEMTTKRKDQGSNYDLPRLDALRSADTYEALSKAVLVILSGKLTDEEFNDLREEIQGKGGRSVWQKDEPNETILKKIMNVTSGGAT